MTGCAVGAWFEFEKAHRKVVDVGGVKVQELYAQAITVASFENDKTGDVEFNKPVFAIKECSAETNAQAIELDKQLQDYFAGYFKRPKVQQADRTSQPDPDDDGRQPEPPEGQEPPIAGDCPV